MIAIEWYPSRRQLRQFGFIATVGFPLAGAVAFFVGGSPVLGGTLVALGAGCLVVALVRPEALRGIYVVMLGASLPIGLVVSGLLLRVLWYGVMTPLGFALRRTGRDPLGLRKAAGAASYWRKRPQDRDMGRYFHQT
jgi:hypothetical protein